MRILHLSDLHLTDDDFPSLNAAFNGIPAYKGERGFDYIVVSGDLSQKAETVDYDRLLIFSRSQLLPLLSKPDAARLIFVPGNHDVDWSADIWSEAAVGHLAQSEAADFKDLIKKPNHAEYRRYLDERGHLRVFRRNANYAARFNHVQKFFDDFYGTLSHPHRKMLLTGPDAEAWSAHVFPEEGVAFVGFNSCCNNDQHWIGASVHPDAIAAAADHLRKEAPLGCVAIAVWHHGLAGDELRPDYLLPRHIGRLYEAGFHVGLHGHTHRDELSNMHELLNGKDFVVVATGSLGAEAADRPGAIGNQFSIIDVLGKSVRSKTYERVGRGNTYSEKHKRVALRLNGGVLKDVSFAATHSRTCVIDDRGIATITVMLTDVEVSGTLVLALLLPPFCETSFDKDAETNLGKKRVHEELLATGGRLYKLEANTAETFRRLTWSYRVSNTLALDTDEQILLPRQHAHASNVPDGCQVRTHTCRFLTEKLELKLTYPATKASINNQPFVERCTVHPLYGYEQWERVDEEERGLHVTTTGATATLVIRNPVPTHRYGIVHAPCMGSAQVNRGGLRWATNLLQMCRNGRDVAGRGTTVDKYLTNALAETLQSMLSDMSGMGWFGMLWEEQSRNLVTAFGNFRASRFAVGDGVVGHAVRIRQVAAWSAKHIANQVLYKRTPGTTGPTHAWVVSVPLLLGPAGSPVGAVSVWAHEDSAASTGRLRIEQMVDDLVTQPSTNLADELLVRLNQTFWIACTEVEVYKKPTPPVTWDLATA